MADPSKEPQADVAIEIDSTIKASDSYVDDQLSAFATSLGSSVLDYPTEHGRRYHAYRAGSYPMPNDEAEQERLDMTHHLAVLGTGDKLFLSPISEPKRILDIGTGTGVWAVEMASLFPDAQILGNDLSAISPRWVPPKVEFEIDDVESAWVHTKPFNFIFSRYMAGSILDWPKYVKTVYDNLSPDGWAEFQDYDGRWMSDDGSLREDGAVWRWIDGLITAGESLGRDPKPGPKLEGWVKEAGFKNVVCQKFKFPIGPWPKDAHLKTVGLWNITQVLDGLEGFSLQLYCRVLGWPEEEVREMLTKVRQDLKSGTIRAYIEYYVVYGQK
ncbi:TAM domain methyltransferase [Immersiella caudata]|uniref:TAM domain methyltransferase n=1 Tax=Immersiella caudata TaxID=314043 RepID=A0AA39WZV9_9PEZI|nr:TAM domain methyltransferase [Immersiella caudata]